MWSSKWWRRRPTLAHATANWRNVPPPAGLARLLPSPPMWGTPGAETSLLLQRGTDAVLQKHGRGSWAVLVRFLRGSRMHMRGTPTES